MALGGRGGVGIIADIAALSRRPPAARTFLTNSNFTDVPDYSANPKTAPTRARPASGPSMFMPESAPLCGAATTLCVAEAARDELVADCKCEVYPVSAFAHR